MYAHAQYHMLPEVRAQSKMLQFLSTAATNLLTAYFLVGFIPTLVFGLILSPLIGTIFVDGYKDLGKKKGDFNTRIGSSVHAFFTSCAAAYLLLTEQTLWEDKLFSPSRKSEQMLEISLGYFCGDYILVLLDPVMRVDKANLAHHFVSASGISISLYLKQMVFFVVYRYINELSTTVVNLFVVLHMLKRPQGAFYITVSITMVVTFFLCRIVLIPVHWVWVYNALLDPQVANVHISIYCWAFVVYPAFDILNIYWFYKMLRGMFKAISKFSKSAQE